MRQIRGNNRSKLIYTILITLVILGFWLFENFYTPATYSGEVDHSFSGALPAFVLPSSTTGEVVAHNYYSLSYNEPYEQAEWVSYTLDKGHLTYDDRKRPYFIEDPDVTTKSADWRNYKGSGYDRGHLCPAGDRRFSEQAYNETFYTSNISPQDRDFNAGIWNDLEKKVRQWAKKYSRVYVITGGVLEPNLPEIGTEDVDVPRYYYKIIAKGEANDLDVVAFLMEGKESNKALQSFVVAVDEVEKRTGIDFFKNLPEAFEANLEKRKDISNWDF